MAKNQLSRAPKRASKNGPKAEAGKASLFEAKPKTYGVADIQPKRDLTHFVKFPRYVRLQRTKKVLLQRVKQPGNINQFNHTLSANVLNEINAMVMKKYRPESTQEKKVRIRANAEARLQEGETTDAPLAVKFGINFVTKLIEQKKAKLVLIAADVDPIEIVMWMPALCTKMDIPYAIVPSKSVLGKMVHLKTAACVAVTDVLAADEAKFVKFCDHCRMEFNDNYAIRQRELGGLKLSDKSTHKNSKQ
ncbi:hypothetical protein PCE1_002361 [Barthelona sp. PCE]